MELIQFVGHLASVGLQLEGNHSVLLSFILDFYETVNKHMPQLKSVHIDLTEHDDVYWFQSACFTLKILCHDLCASQVCDTFLKYGLPLMVMPPLGVFYPALLAIDPVSVDRLAYIMHRWEYLLHMLH